MDTGGGATYTLRFSGDAKFVIASHADGSLKAWSAKDASLLKTIENGVGYIHAYDISKDGKMFAAPMRDGSITVFDTATWNARTIEAHGGAVSYVAFSPDGRYLASSGTDNHLRVRELATLKEAIAFEDVPAGSRVAWTSDGRALVAAGGDGVVRVFGMSK